MNDAAGKGGAQIEFNETLYLDVYGLTLSIRSNSKPDVHDIRRDHAMFASNGRNVTDEAHFRIVHCSYGSVDEVPPHYRNAVAQADPKLMIDPVNAELMLFATRERSSDALRALLIRLIVLHYTGRGFKYFHGSVIERDGSGVAFVGEKGTGKTSLCLDMICRHGWKHVTDDVMMLGVEDGRPVVRGMQLSVNIDASCDDPNAFVLNARERTPSVEKWLLPRDEKRRYYLPVETSSIRTELKHVIFPTIHLLCDTPSIMEMEHRTLLGMIDFNRYKAPVLPRITYPDCGPRCSVDVLSSLRNVKGLLFLGGMNLEENSNLIRARIGDE